MSPLTTGELDVVMRPDRPWPDLRTEWHHAERIGALLTVVADRSLNDLAAAAIDGDRAPTFTDHGVEHLCLRS